jgi:hypothetical protein
MVAAFCPSSFLEERRRDSIVYSEMAGWLEVQVPSQTSQRSEIKAKNLGMKMKVIIGESRQRKACGGPGRGRSEVIRRT